MTTTQGPTLVQKTLVVVAWLGRVGSYQQNNVCYVCAQLPRVTDQLGSIPAEYRFRAHVEEVSDSRVY